MCGLRGTCFGAAYHHIMAVQASAHLFVAWDWHMIDFVEAPSGCLQLQVVLISCQCGGLGVFGL